MSTLGSSQVASSTSKGRSDDMAWEFAECVNPNNTQKLRCKLCGKVVSGGVTRMKEHIGQIKGGVTSCMQATQDQIARAFASHEAPKKRKLEKLKRDQEMKAAVTIEVSEDDQEQL